jgi:hypothetical protein
MALKDIREITVPIELDRLRCLKFDLNAFAELEEKFGSMDAAFQAMQKGSLKAARTLLWAGLLHEDETLTERKVGGMVTLSNLSGIMDSITSALTAAMPDTDGETAGSAADPT